MSIYIYVANYIYKYVLCFRSGDFKLIWGFEGINDGWGRNCTLVWRYRPNVERLGYGDELLKTNMTFIANMRPWEKHVWSTMSKEQNFQPSDLNSGVTHYYNLVSKSWIFNP